jgi:maltooligosyltrehalose trehalohydrolase
MKTNKRTFTVWAPEKETMVLHLVYPTEQQLPMQKGARGYFSVTVPDAEPGCRYYFIPEGEEDTPDPRSHYQPEGVHGPSEVVDHEAYAWQDVEWKGLPFKDLVFYELHVGSCTPEGTFEAMIPLLDDLVDTGINAIELMPVNQFPGARNWGYDGVYPYAVQNSYGGPEGLKKLVDACHQKGIAVFLDVVYNHLGPEGNYLARFGPYFTGKYHTPWGDAINFDGEWSDEVKEYFAGNMLYWFTHYHIDGLRADAVHEVYDRGTPHFWPFCQQQVHQLQQSLGRPLYLVAESDLNSPHVVKQPAAGGWGFHAQWLDDFHHALYVLLDKKGKKYYEDFGRMQQLVKSFKEGFVHSGEYVAFRKRRHGASSAGISGDHFLVFNQNHDIIGNRPGGERWSVLLSFEQLKLAAAAVLLSPYVPLLFMGEEYGEEAPFYFFADHSDESLRASLREGRKKEFEAFHWDKEPPDALEEAVFQQCKLQWQKRSEGRHKLLLNWHKQLIALRRSHPLLSNLDKNNIYITQLGEEGFVLHRQDDRGLQHLLCLFNFSDRALAYTLPPQTNGWRRLLDSLELSPVTVKSGADLVLFPFSVMVYEGMEEK